MITLEDGGIFQRRTKKACLQLIGRLEKIAMKTTLNLSSVSQLNENKYKSRHSIMNLQNIKDKVS